MTDRYWRLCIAELKKEGLVAATASRGYWAVPENTKDVQELEAVLESCEELKSKALDMLTGLNRQIDTLEDRKRALTQQIVMDFTAKAENKSQMYEEDCKV